MHLGTSANPSLLGKISKVGIISASRAVLPVRDKLETIVGVSYLYFHSAHSYSDHWTYITQRLIFLIALVIYLEAGFLVTRETAAEMLGCK